MKRWIIATAAAAAAAALLAGCAAPTPIPAIPSLPSLPSLPAVPSAPAEPEFDELVVESIVYGGYPEDQGLDYPWYVLLLGNPNDDVAIDAYRYSIDAYRADGVLLGSYTPSGVVLPGESAAFVGDFYDLAGQVVDSVEVVVDDDYDSFVYLDPPAGTLGVEEFQLAKDEWGQVNVSGVLTSSFDIPIDYSYVTLVAKDPSGTVIGQTYASVDKLPAGGKALFQASFWYGLPDGTSVDAYAYPGTLPYEG